MEEVRGRRGQGRELLRAGWRGGAGEGRWVEAGKRRGGRAGRTLGLGDCLTSVMIDAVPTTTQS